MICYLINVRENEESEYTFLFCFYIYISLDKVAFSISFILPLFSSLNSVDMYLQSDQWIELGLEKHRISSKDQTRSFKGRKFFHFQRYYPLKADGNLRILQDMGTQKVRARLSIAKWISYNHWTRKASNGLPFEVVFFFLIRQLFRRGSGTDSNETWPTTFPSW